ncbi:hypothetical protein [Corynebacterium endometrii]|uniref:hypothetical protein n=1 Tax=Corynebacterium endometrii TaxID=2488819 RepID=UPI001FE4E782|nr:hypothetical protein [Corynebacterium endometrii]
MSQTAVRKLRDVEELGHLSRADRIATLRAQMEALTTPETAVPAAAPDAEVGEREYLKVPLELEKALPGGGLPRRAVASMADCPALVVELISHVTRAGGHVAVVGWPELSLAQVSESGDISKAIVIPDAGVDPWGVTAVLAEGLDLVIHHGAPVTLSPARARPVLAKIRGGRAAVLSVGACVPSPVLTIRAEVVTYRGIGRGTGRINGVDIAVAVQSKGQRTAHATVTCGKHRKLEAV